MKTTADIEKLSLEELEKMSDDTSVEVPESLERKVTDAVLVADALSETGHRPLGQGSGEGVSNLGEVKHRPDGRKSQMLFPVAAAVVVAAVAIGFHVHDVYRTPVDTFSTPEEALACVERAFGMIGSKTDKSLDVANKINPKLEKTYKWWDK